MTMRQQPGVPTPFRTGRAPDASTPGASRHRIGTSSGLHSDDRPYQTDERTRQELLKKYPAFDALNEEDEDEVYNTRVPSSARRYTPTTTPPRTLIRVTRHQGPPPAIKRASRTQASTTEQRAQQPPRQARGRLHLSVYIGLAMLVMLIGWITLSTASSWWQNEQDTWQYGFPRTFQTDADVRHGGISHFTVENLDGHILITEVQLSTLKTVQVYLGPVFSGAGADQQPATLSFQDVNGDGYPDLVIAVGTGRYVLLNTHTGFRVPTDNDTITERG